ncbi:hypothetical protein FDP41_013661 [Naegleria fowleri]|uniref:Zn(2)-C6 fungal-type domain-containing protein n=1 Tax=Naegleria fowleri TaxID=5763 RepID=A0A6A5BTD0_NAEFO|nr:uncharacterized protein FDP41_013661 [Naegleria fowleri]KAF0980447.1 hypothetical protein FDP41_013661 [Naegleria fowleri]
MVAETICAPPPHPLTASKPCSSCRNLHRKCDKLLPSCSHCLKRGYTCTYVSSPAEQRRTNNKQIIQQHQQPIINSRNFKQNLTKEVIFSISENQHGGTSRNRHYWYQYHPYSQQTTYHVPSSNREVHHTNFHPKRPHLLYADPNQSQIQHAINYRFSATQTLDIYFKFTCLDLPLIERTKLEFIIDNQLTSDGNNGISTYTHPQQPLYNQNELEKDLAVLYLLQAVSLQQAGRFYDTLDSTEQDCLLPQHLFQLGNQLISKYSDNMDSMNLIIATKFMADYLLGEGEKNKARTLMMHVRDKLQPHILNLASNTEHDQQQEWSMQNCLDNNCTEFSHNSRQPNQNSSSDLNFVTHFPSQHFVTAMLLETQLRYADIFFYEEERPTTFIFDEFEALSNRKIKFSKSKLFGQAATSCTDISEEVSQKLIQAIHVGMKCFDSIFTNTVTKRNTILFLMAHLYGRQIYLEILVNSKVRNLSEIMRVCSDIMELALTHTCFPYLPIVATKGILMAISLRFNYFVEYHAKTLENSTVRINFSDDLKILKNLCHRFKLIRNERRDLVKALESLVYLQQEQTPAAVQNEDTLLGNFLPLLDLNRDAAPLLPEVSSKLDNNKNSKVLEANNYPRWTLGHHENFSPHSFKQAVREVLENSELMELFIDEIAQEQIMIKENAKNVTENSHKTQQLLLEKRLEMANKIIALSKKHKDISGLLEGESFKKLVLTEFEK